MTQFRAGLASSKSSYRYVVGGHPVPLRSDRTHTGLWRGVAALSPWPTRAAPFGWNDNVHRSSRVGHFSTLVRDLWISTGILYGVCEGPQHPDYLDQNDCLLDALATQVCALDQGLRIVAGDFNVLEDSLASHAILHRHGFKDAQQIAYERWGIQPQVTCKDASRKDFMYLSPELQMLVTGVKVISGLWSDHSVIEVTFHGGSTSIPKYVWHSPQPIEWPTHLTPVDTSFNTNDVSSEYAEVWHQYEQQAAQTVPCGSSHFGRGKQREPRKVYGNVHAPIRAGRAGDVQPGYHGCHLHHARWFHQARRLQAYARHVKKRASITLHAVELWSSIKRARGFVPSFSKWWLQNEHRVFNAPISLPDGPPPFEVAIAVYDSFLMSLRNLEHQLRTTRHEYVRLQRESNPNLIFKDIKRPFSGGLDLLHQSCQAVISHVDAASQHVERNRFTTIDMALPVHIDGRAYQIIHAEKDCLWLNSVDDLRYGMHVVQCQPVGSLMDLFTMFRNEWDARWNRHSAVPPSQWQAIVQFAKVSLPSKHCTHVEITPGVPEGCALSCLGMVIIDCIFHHWVLATLPDVAPVTYVDDLQVHCASHRIWAVWESVHNFSLAVDIQIDPRKTYTWATDGQSRVALRNDAFAVRTSAKLLGAHVQLTKQHTTQTLKDRIAELDDLWPKLRLSPAVYKLKSRAIRVAAWPRGLHGIPALSISNSQFQSLRTSAMRGLRADGPGCNPHLHLGLVEQSTTDPQFWSILQTFRSARECGDACWVRCLLRDLAHGFLPLPGNGVTSTLLKRITTLGWTVNLHGLLVDNYGTFDLFTADFKEIHLRSELAWVAVVWQQVSSRKFFDGLYRADVVDTRRWLAFLDYQDAAAFRKILNGAHFTADPAAHWNEAEDGTCIYCGCTDSRYHRFWECEHFDACRTGLSDSTRDLLPSLPQALTCGGWSLKPCTLTPWRQYLATLPLVSGYDLHGVLQQLLLNGWCDVFTDGSCFHQDDAQLRCAGWSVVQASPTGDASDAHVIGCGPLPGLMQSSFRAELLAAVLALEATSLAQCKLRLWCDNDGVVRGLLRMISRGRCCGINHPNYDLWSRAWAAVQSIGPAGVVVTHVHAHQPDVDDAFGDWVQTHNALADRLAVCANRGRPDWVVCLHRQHVQQTVVMRRLNRDIQRVQLQVSKAHFQAEKPDRPEVVPVPVVGGSFALTLQPVVRPALVGKYGYDYVCLLYSWLSMVVADPGFDAAQPCWVSTYQLYVDFNTSVGHPGPIVNRGVWQTVHSDGTTFLPGYKFKTLCRWWSHTLNDLLVAMGSQFERRWTRPVSDILCLHCGCFWIPWPPQRLTFLETWFASRIKGTVTRQGTILDTLQPSGRCAAMPAPDFVHLAVR
eukprot:Skav236449  [mRNA]  locus=scaffold1758:16283:20872:+ [translate_table: standard]